MPADLKVLAVLGLWCTLGGAVLLFFYAVPQKNIGNVILHGNIAMQVQGAPSPYDEPAKWQSKADSFLRRAHFLSRLGFAFVAVGTLLQIVAVYRS